MTKRFAFKAQNPYTDAELALLRQHYPHLGPRGMVDLLPGRSTHSITNKANGLNLRVLKRRRKPVMTFNQWKPHELDVMYEHYEAGGIAACEPLLPNRTLMAIRRKACEMKLTTKANQQPRSEFEDVPVVQRHIPAGAWRIDHHLPPASVFGLGAV